MLCLKTRPNDMNVKTVVGRENLLFGLKWTRILDPRAEPDCIKNPWCLELIRVLMPSRSLFELLDTDLRVSRAGDVGVNCS